MRITVAIPLYEAGRWRERVSENISRLPPDAEILVSSQTPEDGVSEFLRSRHGNDRRLVFLEPEGVGGWREHANHLIGRCRTEAFSILAQDDWVGADYYPMLEDALAADPQASMTFARLLSHDLPGHDPQYHPSPPESPDGMSVIARAVQLVRDWNPGIAYRGLVRSRCLNPIPKLPGDVLADVIWVFGIACQGPIIEVPGAVYHKQHHDRNTHAGWGTLAQEFNFEQRLGWLEEQIRQALEGDASSIKKALKILRRNYRDGKGVSRGPIGRRVKRWIKGLR